MNIKLKNVPVCAESVKTRREDFGMLLVSKRTPILTLNDDSVAIWQKMDGIKDISAIISELRNEYDCSEKELEETVLSFFDSCHKLGIIEFR